MNYRRYIQGNRKGKEANRIEREAMKDPLLSEALEGYDRLQENPEERIDDMRRQIIRRTQSRSNWPRYVSIAACFLLVIGLGGYLVFIRKNLPQEENLLSQLEIQERILPVESPEPEELVVLNQDIEEKKETKREITKETKRETKEEKAPPISAPVIQADAITPVESEQLITQAIPEKASPDMTEGLALREVTAVGYGIRKKQSTVGSVTLSVSKAQSPVIGQEAYEKYIRDNIIQPTDENCKKEGKVVLSFHVDPNGRPYRIEVKESLCEQADQEAIRLVKEGPDWETGVQEVKQEVRF